MRFIRACLALFVMIAAVPAAAESWHRADTHHFIIYSDGRASQLEDFAHEVEKFDALLRMVFGRPAKEDPAKLTIYLLGDADDVSRLAGGNVAGFYSVNEQHTFAVANREYGRDNTDLSGQRVLFHEYAHHFMFHNFAIPAPAWFVEGFAEYVATAEFKRNGKWTFGMPAHHRAWSVQNGPSVPIEQLLAENYNGMNPAQTASFYAWAWALTHMFYSDPDERGDQVSRYLRDLNRGMDNLEAAQKHFGDLDQLEQNLRSYVRRSMAYSRSDREIPYRDDITVSSLSDAEGDLVRLRLLRLTNNDWDELQGKFTDLANQSNMADAWYELAEWEFTAAHRNAGEDDAHDFTATNAAVDRALALEVDHTLANILKGRLYLEPFDHEDDPDTGNYALARQHFMKANRADPSNAHALYLYARTFQREGVPHEMVGPALESAFLFRPESRSIRAAMANHYANEGEYDAAIGLLKIIANNPHGGGQWARRTITALEAARDGGIGLPDISVSIDDGGDEDVDGPDDAAGEAAE